MNSMLRGVALSIVLYLVVTGLIIFTVILCGGEFHQIPGILFPVIGICTGIFAGVINNELD